MQQYRERSLIKGLQVCCLEVVTHRDSDSENSPSQTQKLNTYRNKIASEALVSCNCSMLPSNQTCTHYFFPSHVYITVFSTAKFCHILISLNMSHSPCLILFSSSVKLQREMFFSSILFGSKALKEQRDFFFLLDSEANSTEAPKPKNSSSLVSAAQLHSTETALFKEDV